MVRLRFSRPRATLGARSGISEGDSPIFVARKSGQSPKHGYSSYSFNEERFCAVADNVYKKIELVGTSHNSFSEAAANAIAKASESLHNMSWFEVLEQRGRITDGKIEQYQVTVAIGFRVE